MQKVGRRIADRSVLDLIRMWLRSPVVEGGQSRKSQGKGTPQGGVISPLLANIYLHELDRFFTKKQRDRGKPLRPCWCGTRMTLWSWPERTEGEWRDGSKRKLERDLGLKVNREQNAHCANGAGGKQPGFSRVYVAVRTGSARKAVEVPEHSAGQESRGEAAGKNSGENRKWV